MRLWNICGDVTIPFRKITTRWLSDRGDYGIHVATFKQLFQGSPYDAFLRAVLLWRKTAWNHVRKCGSLSADLKRRCDALQSIVEGEDVSVGLKIDTEHNEVGHSTRTPESFKRLMLNILDNWEACQLNKYGLFDVPDAKGIKRDCWLLAWRRCMEQLEDRCSFKWGKQAVLRSINPEEFMNTYVQDVEWRLVPPKPVQLELGLQMEPVQEPKPEIPQVISDHSTADDMLDAPRVFHHVKIVNFMVFELEFDTSDSVLEGCLKLVKLPNEITDVEVKCNGLVVRIKKEMTVAYPCSESLSSVNLAQQGAVIDKLYADIAGLVKHVEAINQ